MGRIREWFKRLRRRLRKRVQPTVTSGALTVEAGTTGMLTVAITAIEVDGAEAPDGTLVSIPFTDPNGKPDSGSPITGATSGGAFSAEVAEGSVPGTYNFGPAVIDGETVAADVAAFTRSASF